MWPYWGYTVDDAAISYAYARNWAGGLGWVHCVGAEPVEGFSNPSWVLLLAGLHALGLPIPLLAKLLSLFFAQGSLLLSFLLPSRLLDRSLHLRDLLAPLWLASAPVFGIWSLAGLENALFLFLILAALYSSLGERYLLSAFLLLALALSRPEGLLYALPFALWRGSKLGEPESRRAFLLSALILGLGGGLFLLWRWQSFGEWLPNTAIKVEAQQSELPFYHPDSNGGLYIQDYFRRWHLRSLLPIALFALFPRRRRAQRLLLGGLMAVVLFFPLYAGGDWMKEFRFLYPVPALLGIAFVLGLESLEALIAPRLPRRLIPYLGLSGALLVLLPGVRGRLRRLHRHPKPAWSMEDNARAALAFQRLQAHIGEGQRSVLLPDLGAPIWYSDLMIHDLGSLANRPLARLSNQERALSFVYGELRPDFVIAAAVWRDHRVIFEAAPLEQGYYEMDRGPEFPHWDFGIARVRRELIVEEVPPSLNHPERRLGKLRILGADPLPGQISPGATIHLNLYAMAQRRLRRKTQLSVVLLKPRAEGEWRPLKEIPLESAYGLVPVKSWIPGDVIHLRAEIQLPKEPGALRLALKAQNRRGPLKGAKPQYPLMEFELLEGASAFELELEALSFALKRGDLGEAMLHWRQARGLLPPRARPLFPEQFAKKHLQEQQQPSLEEQRVAEEPSEAELKALILSRTEPSQQAALEAAYLELLQAHCREAKPWLESDPMISWRRWRWVQERRRLRCGFEGQLSQALVQRGGLLDLLRAATLLPENVQLRGEAEARRREAPPGEDQRLRLQEQSRLKARAFHLAPSAQSLGSVMQAWLEEERPWLALRLCQNAATLCAEGENPKIRERAQRAWGAALTTAPDERER